MFRLLILTAVGALGLFLPSRAWADPRYPHLHHAIHEMREAHKELKATGHDFGGHREKALMALDAAIKQTELALAGAGDAYGGFKPDKKIYEGYKHHPHLHHAMHEMRE